MQRFVSLTAQASRLIRFTSQVSATGENSLLKRTLSTKNADKHSKNSPNPRLDLYKPSTAMEETHVPDDLHSGQPLETIETTPKNPMAKEAKVWSNQTSDSVHVGAMNSSVTKPVSTPSSQASENQTDSFVDPMAKPPVTPAELAEAAAKSAFEPFAPNTPLNTPPAAAANFAPKIASVDIHSSASSPTAHFDTAVRGETNAQAAQDAIHYEAAPRGKVYGGLDTSADSKKHPKENPFNTQEKIPM